MNWDGRRRSGRGLDFFQQQRLDPSQPGVNARVGEQALGTLVDDDVPFTVWYNGTSFELVNAGWNDGPVEMEVFSLSGGLVNRERVSVSGGRATLPAVAVASGLYTIRVVGATSTMQRVVVP